MNNWLKQFKQQLTSPIISTETGIFVGGFKYLNKDWVLQFYFKEDLTLQISLCPAEKYYWDYSNFKQFCFIIDLQQEVFLKCCPTIEALFKLYLEIKVNEIFTFFLENFEHLNKKEHSLFFSLLGLINCYFIIKTEQLDMLIKKLKDISPPYLTSADSNIREVVKKLI